MYSPHLTSTLLCEDDILRSQRHMRSRDFTTTIAKHCEAGTFTLKCVHTKHPHKKFAVHGIIAIGNKCHTQPLIMPNLPANHPDANECNSLDSALIEDRQFARDCCHSTIKNTQLFQQRSHECLAEQLQHLPNNCGSLSVNDVVKNATDVLSLIHI